MPDPLPSPGKGEGSHLSHCLFHLLPPGHIPPIFSCFPLHRGPAAIWIHPSLFPLPNSLTPRWTYPSHLSHFPFHLDSSELEPAQGIKNPFFSMTFQNNSLFSNKYLFLPDAWECGTPGNAQVLPAPQSQFGKHGSPLEEEEGEGQWVQRPPQIPPQIPPIPSLSQIPP